MGTRNLRPSFVHANVGRTFVDGSPTAAMDDAQKALDAALARRTKIEELLVVARAAVEEDRRNNLGILGAPKKARKNKTAGLSAAVVRLESGLLPGEHREVQAKPPGFLAASARANAQHHAQAEQVPPGRRPREAAASGSRIDDDDDEPADAAGAEDDDDDHEDAEFAHFYRVSSNQRDFNRSSAKAKPIAR